MQFTLPETFNPAEFGLRPSLVDPSRWLISTIVRKTADRKVDERGIVRLHSKVLQGVCHDRYSDVVKPLKTGGVIETFPYSAGEKSTGYRLTAEYVDQPLVRVPCTDPYLAERIRRGYRQMDERKKKGKRLPIHERLEDCQRELTVSDDAETAIASFTKPAARLGQRALVHRIRHGEFSSFVSPTGRWFNAITNMKKELRRCLLLAGEPVGCVDICESQPALLASMILQHYHPSLPSTSLTYKGTVGGRGGESLPADLLDYCSLVSAGSFYEALGGMTGTSRPRAKKRFLVDVLAKKGNYPSKIEDAFRDRFPTVYEFIRRTNRKSHAELIRRLQRAEADFVIGSVAPRLVDSIPVVSLHDALYGRLGDVDEIETAFHATCEEAGFKMAFKREV
jgi:hypothetical protein